jgi:hypothetical protein
VESVRKASLERQFARAGVDILGLTAGGVESQRPNECGGEMVFVFIVVVSRI